MRSETAMPGFRHPRPFSRKEVAMQVVQQESRAFDATELRVDLPERPVVAPPPDDAPIRFSVAYSLGEYLGFVRDHLAFLARRGKPGARRRAWEGMVSAACVALLATPVFYWKKRRMPVCEFRIDAAGIERGTRQGCFMRRWDEVRAVRRYRRGYLVMFEKGAIPIPFRCLTAEQQEGLRALFLGRAGQARVQDLAGRGCATQCPPTLRNSSVS
jgi:hypothetical protein